MAILLNPIVSCSSISVVRVPIIVILIRPRPIIHDLIDTCDRMAMKLI